MLKVKSNKIISETVHDVNTRNYKDRIEIDSSLAQNIINVLTNPSTQPGRMFSNNAMVLSKKVKNEDDKKMLELTPQAYFSKTNITNICEVIYNSSLKNDGYYIGKIYALVQPIGITTRDNQRKRFPSRIILCFFKDENDNSLHKFDIAIYTPNRYELYPYLLTSGYGDFEDRSTIEYKVYTNKDGTKVTDYISAANNFKEWAQYVTDTNSDYSKIYISIGLIPADKQTSSDVYYFTGNEGIMSINQLENALSNIKPDNNSTDDDAQYVTKSLLNPDTAMSKAYDEKRRHYERINDIMNNAANVVDAVVSTSVSMHNIGVKYNKPTGMLKEKDFTTMFNNEWVDKNYEYDKYKTPIQFCYAYNVKPYNMYVENMKSAIGKSVKYLAESVIQKMVSDETNEQLSKNDFLNMFNSEFNSLYKTLNIPDKKEYIYSLFEDNKYSDGSEGIYYYYNQLLNKNIIKENLNTLMNNILRKLVEVKEHGVERKTTMLQLNENMSIKEIAKVESFFKKKDEPNLNGKFVVRKNEQGHLIFLKDGILAIRNYKNATLYGSKEDADSAAKDAGNGWEVVDAKNALNEYFDNKYVRHGTVFESKEDYIKFSAKLKETINSLDTLSNNELSEKYSEYKDSDNFFDNLICEKLVEVARDRCSTKNEDANSIDDSDYDEYDDDENDVEDEKEIIHTDNPLSELTREPSMTIEDVDGESYQVYVDFENGTPQNPSGRLIAGTILGGSVVPQFSIDYDWDSSLDDNLQNLYDIIMEQDNI